MLVVGGDRMELKIYADVLFAVTALMMFAAYGAAAVLVGYRTGIGRLLAGAALVGLISTAAVLCLGSRLAVLSVIPLGMLGTYLCLGRMSLRKNLLCTALALLFAALTGGVRTALGNIGLSGSTNFTAAVLYVLLRLCVRHISARTVKKQHIYRLTVCKGGVSIELNALADTGNELKGADGESVIIADKNAVRCLFEAADTDIRLIPCVTVGGEGTLIGVRCDSLAVNGVTKQGVIVAAAKGRLGNGVYNALIYPETEVI